MLFSARGAVDRATTTGGSAALSLVDVRAGYRGTEVLGGVDLQVERGEWVAVIGPNGAGKSTLLRAVAGLCAHTGEITAAGGVAPDPRGVSLVPQSPVLPDGMTAAEYVLIGRTAHLGWLSRESRADRRIAAQVLSRLDLHRLAHRQVTALSGGEAQRVVLARALAQQAPVMLLDEPTSALDLGHQVDVLELVDGLRRADGLSVVAAMHDLSTAARFADRLLLIDHGRVVALGTPAEVLQPALLSRVYGTQLTVRVIDGERLVLPAARPRTHPTGRVS